MEKLVVLVVLRGVAFFLGEARGVYVPLEEEVPEVEESLRIFWKCWLCVWEKGEVSFCVS